MLILRFFGIVIRALLDTGAARTILVGTVYDKLGQTIRPRRHGGAHFVRVANGFRWSVRGYATLPIKMDGKIMDMEVFIVPAVDVKLILRADFFEKPR